MVDDNGNDDTNDNEQLNDAADIESGVDTVSASPKPDAVPGRYPVLPLRDMVVFPHMIVPLFVGRDKSVRALEEVMNGDKQIMLVAQKEASEENPNPEDLFKTGVIGTVLQLLKLPDGAIKVLVEGGSRAGDFCI